MAMLLLYAMQALLSATVAGGYFWLHKPVLGSIWAFTTLVWLVGAFFSFKTWRLRRSANL